MKLYVDAIEEYPVFVLQEESCSWQSEVELPEADYADYKRVLSEYDAWQKRLRDMI